MLLTQKNAGPSLKIINEAIRLFSGLADLDYEPGAYHFEEIYSKYIIQIAGKSFTVVDYPSKVYGLSNTHECIDGNLPLRLVLDAFALARSSNTNKCSWHIVYPYARFIYYRDLEGFVKKVADRVGKLYSVFINFDLYKSCFSLCLLGSAKEDRVKRPAISSIKIGYYKLENYLVQPKSNYSEIWPRTFSSEKPEKEEFQSIEDKTALSVGAGLVIAKYGWLEVGDIRKEFINFQAITNIATSVHVEALTQMLYQIRDCLRHIVSLFYQKNSNELFRPPGHENIRAELANARPNNLSTAIKGHRE
ncbi:hypothetical protein C1646_677253 [Rhizophagus diaphanus]|nr:hypothetical protein C1646_677253 [Rhizophagus diaphanus] [Rhizophagus sp. MUCL 43196]